MGIRRIAATLLAVLLLALGLGAESVAIVNRTGRTLDLIQAAPSGRDQWGDDLIPGRVVLDGESVGLDLVGQAPWAFRFLDSRGEVYVLYDVDFSRTGKLTVGPEHMARLSRIAGERREVSVANRTGAPISSLRISAVDDGAWGDDVLAGRYIRDGETAVVTVSARPGALSVDIRFTLIADNREIAYEKTEVILTDRASLVLSAR